LPTKKIIVAETTSLSHSHIRTAPWEPYNNTKNKSTGTHRFVLLV
jgi:hypothetical protein